MNRIAVYFIALAAFAILVAGCTSDEGTTGSTAAKTQTAVAAAQTTCPVMGGAIDKKVFTDHDGKRVYFCCPACIDTFKKDPAKYLKKLADAGVTLEKAPEAPAK